jgi:type VI secretion system secreted protein Hcp
LANNIYLSIEGEATISAGANTEKSIGQFAVTEHEDEISVLEFSWGMYVPTDKLSGQITGNRRHQHLTIKKHLDAASPVLAQCLTAPVPLTCTFTFVRPDGSAGSGEPEEFYTIELEGAKVTHIEITSPNILDPEMDHMPAYEVVTFAYNKVTGTHDISATTFTDTWTGE